MADTIRMKSELLVIFENNTSGDITPQDCRDLIVSVYNETEAGELKVSSNDTTKATLSSKLAAGSNVGLAITNPGANELITISASSGIVQGTDEVYDLRPALEGIAAGNARGEFSTDLQTKRSAASQVASGSYCSILGGYDNTASGINCAVLGANNTVSGEINAVFGYANVVSDGANTVCGVSNTVSGYTNVVSGYANTVTSSYSSVTGSNANSVLNGSRVHGSIQMNSNGDAQLTESILRNQTSNNTPTELFINNDSARLVLSDDATWAFRVLVTARRTDVNDEGAGYEFLGVIDRNTGVATTSLIGSVAKTIIAEDTAAWDVNVDADTTNGSLRIIVTGEAAKTIKWVAYVNIVQTLN